MTVVESSSESCHRDYVRLRSRRAPFLPRVGEEAAQRAMDLAYRAWAHSRGLSGAPGAHRFSGTVRGRRVAFASGLGGSTPNQVELAVEVDLPVAEPVLVSAAGSSAANAPSEEWLLCSAELFEAASSGALRSVGITPRGIRLRFAPLVGPDDLDATLDHLVAAVDAWVGATTARCADTLAETQTCV